MNWERMVRELTAQPWVDAASKSLRKGVAQGFEALGPARRPIENFLHGVWLGHPLHPVLTDLPIGAWTVAAALDVLDMTGQDDRLAAGADTAVALGLGGAVGAALTGMTDWHKTDGAARRIGLVHALFNTTAATLYGLSIAARKSGNRPLGRALAFTGYAAMFGGAYLGGHLVFGESIGVDQTASESLAAGQGEPDFRPVLSEEALIEGQPQRALLGETPVMLLRSNGFIYALADTCSHLGCSLAESTIEDGTVRCHCHGSRYALADGRVLDGPSAYWQPAYDVRVRGGQVEIRLREMGEGA